MKHIFHTLFAVFVLVLAACVEIHKSSPHATQPTAEAQATPVSFTPSGRTGSTTEKRHVYHGVDVTELLAGRVPVKIFTGELRRLHDGKYYYDFTVLQLTDDDHPKAIVVRGYWIGFYGQAHWVSGTKLPDGSLSFDHPSVESRAPFTFDPNTGTGTWRLLNNKLTLTKITEIPVSGFARNP